eukprot:CAMPEP_0198244832 /NCGR_PEP_ID=MMETSP1446-20131203/37707_1 /TAXON_ID=1461542 ORGANISM="Unidentified sp, Strain CCMP2111" /NCGR_SAMPLE_ID=MMETSP1446 /ASSEMBLY_ACC=CAM_ASM_001112 /LENGTH=167 /DNA_ID=CAMNT_0043928933 /DNA_START=174 /DNA_END=674 /DNA_ORIENTATION=-
MHPSAVDDNTISTEPSQKDEAVEVEVGNVDAHKPHVTNGGFGETSNADVTSSIVGALNLELLSYYQTSESGLQPHIVVHKLVSSMLKGLRSRLNCPMRLDVVSGCASALFVPRKLLKAKYETNAKKSSTVAERKAAKMKEYLVQIMLRLEVASQAVSLGLGSEVAAL